jgi:hypothetical protein
VDFWDTGRRLQARWLQQAREFQEAFAQGRDQVRPGLTFVVALSKFAKGDASELIEHLRSDRELSPWRRELLAQVLEGQLDQVPREGHPPDEDAWQRAIMASVFYEQWRKENRRRGIKDHGHAGHMKDEAARFVIEELDPRPGLDLEAVRQRMDRSRSRRPQHSRIKSSQN